MTTFPSAGQRTALGPAPAATVSLAIFSARFQGTTKTEFIDNKQMHGH